MPELCLAVPAGQNSTTKETVMRNGHTSPLAWQDDKESVVRSYRAVILTNLGNKRDGRSKLS